MCGVVAFDFYVTQLICGAAARARKEGRVAHYFLLSECVIYTNLESVMAQQMLGHRYVFECLRGYLGS